MAYIPFTKGVHTTILRAKRYFITFPPGKGIGEQISGLDGSVKGRILFIPALAL